MHSNRENVYLLMYEFLVLIPILRIITIGNTFPFFFAESVKNFALRFLAFLEWEEVPHHSLRLTTVHIINYKNVHLPRRCIRQDTRYDLTGSGAIQ
jgi:hypothetical protein